MSNEKEFLDAKTLADLLGDMLDSEPSKKLLAAVAGDMTDQEILDTLLQLIEEEA